MHQGMIKGVATSMWVAFESGDNGMNYFVILISTEIVKVGVGTHCN